MEPACAKHTDDFAQGLAQGLHKGVHKGGASARHSSQTGLLTSCAFPVRSYADLLAQSEMSPVNGATEQRKVPSKIKLARLKHTVGYRTEISKL